MSIILFIVNKISGIFPPTRFFRLKSFLYKFAGVLIHDSTRLVSSVEIWGKGQVSIGKNTFVGHEVLILTGAETIEIGDYVDIGPRVTIVNGTHELDMIGTRSAGKGKSEKINIGSGVWVGASLTILSGVKIGDKSMIAAGSVVNRDIPSNVIAAGIPCKPIKKWSTISECWEQINNE